MTTISSVTAQDEVAIPLTLQGGALKRWNISAAISLPELRLATRREAVRTICTGLPGFNLLKPATACRICRPSFGNIARGLAAAARMN